MSPPSDRRQLSAVQRRATHRYDPTATSTDADHPPGDAWADADENWYVRASDFLGSAEGVTTHLCPADQSDSSPTVTPTAGTTRRFQPHPDIRSSRIGRRTAEMRVTRGTRRVSQPGRRALESPR
ncbi:hypothetical protein C8039_14245 [Halogeometricum sp. wsp3]|nr:hypothetical protein C8039_14245 [Halogeometricum sp. wsp3]